MNIPLGKALSQIRVFLIALSLSGALLSVHGEDDVRIVIHDTFSRSGELFESEPDTVNVLNARWKDNLAGLGKDGLLTDGSGIVVDRNDLVSLSLHPLDLSSTAEIAISAELANTHSWIAFGFADGSNLFDESKGGVSWVQLWGSEIRACKRMGGDEIIRSPVVDRGDSIEVRIVLNRKDNTSKFWINGKLAVTFNYGTFPNFDRVFVHGSDGSNGIVKNLQVSVSDGAP